MFESCHSKSLKVVQSFDLMTSHGYILLKLCTLTFKLQAKTKANKLCIYIV